MIKVPPGLWWKYGHAYATGDSLPPFLDKVDGAVRAKRRPEGDGLSRRAARSAATGNGHPYSHRLSDRFGLPCFRVPDHPVIIVFPELSAKGKAPLNRL